MPLSGKTLDRLRENDPSLTTLSLWSKHMETGGTRQLSRTLKSNTRLKSLNMWNNSVEVQDVERLSHAIRYNKGISKLDLRLGTLGAEGMTRLQSAIEVNRTITWMNLSCNAMGDGGAVALGQALTSNRSIHTVILRTNFIRNEGGRALARAIESNPVLRTVDLSDNHIGDKACQALGEAIAKNTTLVELNLAVNRIGDRGGAHLAKGMADNYTLQVLDVAEREARAEGDDAATDGGEDDFESAREDPVPWALIKQALYKNQAMLAKTKEPLAPLATGKEPRMRPRPGWMGGMATQTRARAAVQLEDAFSMDSLPLEYYLASLGITHTMQKGTEFRETIARTQLVNDTVRRANRAIEAGRFRDAVKLLSAALLKDSGNGYVRYQRGCAQMALKEHRAAALDFEAALAQQPDHCEALLRRAECLEMTDEIADAIDLYKRALELAPDNPAAARKVAQLSPLLSTQGFVLFPETLPELEQIAASAKAIIMFAPSWAEIGAHFRDYFQGLSEELKAGLAFAHVNVTEKADMAAAHSVLCPPEFHVYKEGERVAVLSDPDVSQVARFVEM